MYEDRTCQRPSFKPYGQILTGYDTAVLAASMEAIPLPDAGVAYEPSILPVNEEDKWLWARNKWLLAHGSSSEAGQGACVGLTGENINIEKDI